jgi:hypothetical protein
MYCNMREGAVPGWKKANEDIDFSPNNLSLKAPS